MGKAGIVIVDDHQLLREGLEMLIANESAFEVLAAASNGRDGVKLVNERKPEIVILDIGMPDMNGIEACRQIKQFNPRTRVLALSMHSSHRVVKEMLQAGASGYVLKVSGFKEIITALKTITGGNRYLSPEVVDVVVDEVIREPGEEILDPFAALSSREREVAQLLAEGKTAKEIAFALDITVRTVDAHKKSTYEKLGVSNLAELTRFAIREGLIDSHLQEI